DALAAIVRRRALRQLRSFRARPEHQYPARPNRRESVAARSGDRETDRQSLGLYRLERLVFAGVRRPVQYAEPRHADPAAAKVRKYGSWRQMEHPAEAAVHRRSL